MTALLVEMIGMQKRFGAVRAVDDVSCELHAGEVVGLLGHNGAGKTTLMKLLAGVYPEYGGTIKVHGSAVRLVTPRDAQRAGIETIYQHLALADNLDAAGNLFLGRELRTGWGTLDTHRMAHEAGQIVRRINPSFTQTHLPVHALSGGQRQTVAIARALYFEARILIMDEPTGGMSLEERRVTGELLQPIKKHCSLVIVEHDLDFIRDICDRLTVLDQGKVLASGTVSEIQANTSVQEIYLRRA